VAKSRLYCTIAAYQASPHDVARAFNSEGDLPDAIRGINALTPQSVYARLRAHLPEGATRRFLAEVTARMLLFGRVR